MHTAPENEVVGFDALEELYVEGAEAAGGVDNEMWLSPFLYLHNPTNFNLGHEVGNKNIVKSNDKLQLPSVPAVTSSAFIPPPKPFLFTSQGTLNLEVFKAFPCKNESSVHDRKGCPFYHNQRDRRRHPVTYRAEQCEDHFDLDTDFNCACPDGERCRKCHNRHELLYHPEIYKQRFCSSYPNVECHRGRLCAFAHMRGEIRCQLFDEESEHLPTSNFFMLEFKTLWCPYGIQHDWHGCLYAHTYQDCRRSPQIGYGSEPCPYWQKDLHSADYQKRCPLGSRCPYSHGSKEQLYHPAYYKSMPCADYKTRKSCPRGELCAFYHDQMERRPVPENFQVNSTDASPGTIARSFDYSVPIEEAAMSHLQSLFMRPPLFNLDDFEAFGHASRCGTGRRSSAASTSHRFSFHSPTPASYTNRQLPPPPSKAVDAENLDFDDSPFWMHTDPNLLGDELPSPSPSPSTEIEEQESVPMFTSMTIVTGPEPQLSLQRLLQLIGNHRPVIFVSLAPPPPGMRTFTDARTFWIGRGAACRPLESFSVLSQIVAHQPIAANGIAVAFDHLKNSDIAASERLVSKVLDMHPTFTCRCEVFHHVRVWTGEVSQSKFVS